MNLLARVKRVARVAYEAVERDAETPQASAPEVVLEQGLARLEGKLASYDHLVRQNKAYYELVASFQKQRDQWKEMFLTQSVENAAAQSFMNAELEKAGHIISAVVTLLNQERTAAEKPLFKLEHKLDTGQAVKKRYEELIADLKKEAPGEVDFLRQRDEIAAGDGLVRFEHDKLFEKDVQRCVVLACALPVGHDGDHRTADGFAAWRST